MTDDPWRKPDPPQAVPPPPPPHPTYPGPPPYGPPNTYQTPYGPPPYGQYNPNNPYNAPLPQRGGIGRLLWILCGAGLLLLGGCGVGIYLLAHNLTKNADEVNAFLRNVRDQQFTSAYQHLCPSAGTSETAFVAALQGATSRGHQVSSFDITLSNTSKVSGAGTVRSASGEVTFADHITREIAFTLDKPNGHLCISSGFTALY